MGWDELLPRLAMQPRENGSAALAQTADYLATTLAGFGIPVERLVFTAYPYRHRICGVVALIATLAYAWALRSRRRGLAIVIALLSPILILVELDYYVGIVTWPGALQQEHIIARIVAPEETQRVILTAHYDTKTDLLDHVQRAPVDLLSLPMTILMVSVPLVARARRRRAADWNRLSAVESGVIGLTLIYGVAVFLVLTGGAFVRQRSPGALDDGAACALLVRVAEALSQRPLRRTTVEIALLSAEEIGVQGSRDFVQARLTPVPPNTSVLNFEFIGAAPDLAVFGSERFTLHSYPPDAGIVRMLDGIHRTQRKVPLHVTWYGAGTDARSFLHAGIPAVTLLSDLPEHAVARSMHSAADSIDRVDRNALDETFTFVMTALREMNRRAPNRDS